MKTIEITNGQVVIKDFMTRKLRKEINRAMFANVETKTNAETGKAELSNFNIADSDLANDVTLCGMVESITIGGEVKPVTVETFDSLPYEDVDKIIAEINGVTSKEIPNA